MLPGADFRGYTKRGLLRGNVTEELDYSEDVEPEEDEEQDGWTESSDDLDHGTVGIDVETEDEGFD